MTEMVAAQGSGEVYQGGPPGAEPGRGGGGRGAELWTCLVCSAVQVRLIPHTWAAEFRQQAFLQMRRDPFYLGREILFNIYTGFTVRKEFSLKEELDDVVGRLQV